MTIGGWRRASVVGVVLALTAACSGGDDTKEPQGPEPAPTWLSVDEEIVLGERRYVSPCQVLTLDDVTDIVGELVPRAGIVEEYVDESQPADDTDFTTRCHYFLYGATGVSDIMLSVEQPTEAPRALDTRDLVGGGLERTEARVARIEQVVAAEGPARELATQMRASVDIVAQRIEIGLDAEDLPEDEAAALVVPGNVPEFSVKLPHEDLVWDISIAFGDHEGIFDNLTDDQVRELMDVTAGVVERARAHLADDALSQEPAPTYLGQERARADTAIVEPCSVLSQEVFEQIVGHRPNGVIERWSAPYDLAGTPRAVTGGIILPSNSCRRQYNSSPGAFDASTTTAVDISISYGADEDENITSLTDGDVLPLGPDDTELETDADRAFETTFLDSQQYRFLVGTYSLNVRVTRTEKEAGFGDIETYDGSRDDHVKAINALVPSLRAAIEHAATLARK